MRERITLQKPIEVARRPATTARSVTASSTPSRAEMVRERLGNAGSQAIVTRSVAARSAAPIQHTESTATPAVQRSANVSSPHDRAEIEASEVARTVMRTSAPAQPATQLAALHDAPVQRTAAATGMPAPTPAASVPTSGGSQLPMDVRQFMEHRFGASFEAIRIHSDEAAARQSAELNAHAFTVGKHIFFGRDQFRPDTTAGRELIAHELTHTIQQGEVMQRGAAIAVAQRNAPAIQRAGGIRDWIADQANSIPGFRMFTIVLGVNPISMNPVDRSAANVLRAIVEFIPGGTLIAQALETHGVFERAGAWITQKINTLGLAAGSIRQALDQFISGLSLWDLRPTNWGTLWETAKRIFTAPIDRITSFVAGLATDVIQFIREAILLPLAALAEGTRGYDLLKAVLGQDPITGAPVARSPENLIGGFMKLIGQEEVWENIQKANAIPRCWAWFQGALQGLMGFVRQIPARLVAAIKSLEVSDMILVPKAFAKIVLTFAGFLEEFLKWAGEAVWHLLEIIFEVVAPGAIPYLKKAAGSFRSILKNPIGFVGNLVKAGKLGLQNFADNIGQHLKASLLEWLTGSLPGVYIPQKLELGEIVKFVLSVLGISWANIRAKLVKAVGEPAVKAMEVGFDIVVTLVREGPAAAWDKIKEQLANLKDMVIQGITDFVVETIVKKAIAKVVSLLVPGGAFLQAIISIYDTIMVFIDKLQKIIQVATAFLDTIMAIAAGAIEGAAKKVESTLAGLLTLAISFLAGFLGLGKIADKIMEIINTKVRAPIDKALDFLVNWIVTAAKKLFAGAKAGAKALIGWAKSKAGFSDEEGHAHSIYVDDAAGQPRLMIASNPLAARVFVTDYIKQKSAKYQGDNKDKIAAVEAAVAAAEKQIADMAKAGKSEDDAQLQVLLGLNVAVGKALSALLNSDAGLKSAREKYLLEGLAGTYASIPKPKGDELTPDHQPQAAALQAAASFGHFTPSGALVERADKRAAQGFAINLHRVRHAAGRTYGGKGSKTKEEFLKKVEKAVDKAHTEEKQRKAVVKVLKNELEEDVKAMKKVAKDKANYSDLDQDKDLKDLKAKEKTDLITEIGDRIVAGEDQIAAQDLDSLAS
jgi:hypothetical protein